MTGQSTPGSRGGITAVSRKASQRDNSQRGHVAILDNSRVKRSEVRKPSPPGDRRSELVQRPRERKICQLNEPRRLPAGGVGRGLMDAWGKVGQRGGLLHTEHPVRLSTWHAGRAASGLGKLPLKTTRKRWR